MRSKDQKNQHNNKNKDYKNNNKQEKLHNRLHYKQIKGKNNHNNDYINN